MRSKKILINTVYSIVSAIVMALLALITRRFFLTYFGVSLLGYDSLFSNVFSLLALSDLGVGTVITYALYQEVAKENRSEIAKLMNLYKKFYYVVGGFVLLVGIIVYFFIPFIVEDGLYDWDYVRFIYSMQLISTLCTYFLAYRRILYTVDQKAYVCVNIETIISVIASLVKITAVVYFQNLFLFFMATILTNLGSNLIISIRYRKDYSYACKNIKLEKGYLKKRNFFSDIKNNMACRVAETIFSSTDSILISKFIGINQVGMYTNYMVIDGYIGGILIKLLKPVQAAIGNYIYKESKENNKRMLSMLNLFSYLIASFIACSYFTMFQQLIGIWIGENYHLPMLFVLFLSINCYIRWNYYFVYMYRNTWGDFNIDRNYYIASAIVNILVSIFLQKYIGIAGIMLGTVIGQMFFWIGRAKVVYKTILNIEIYSYIKRQVKQASILGIELLVCFTITSNIEMDFGGFIVRCLCCLLVPNLCNWLFCKKLEEYQELLEYFIHKVLPIIIKKKSR